MKICTVCKCEKDESEFSVQRRNTKKGSVARRRSECRLCYNEYIRKYLKNNKTHQELVASGKKKRIIFVQELKIQTGCLLCKYNKCASALHYHHLDPLEKEFEISWAASRQLSEEKILREIKKCVLLCSNCHAEVESGITKLNLVI